MLSSTLYIGYFRRHHKWQPFQQLHVRVCLSIFFSPLFLNDHSYHFLLCGIVPWTLITFYFWDMDYYTPRLVYSGSQLRALRTRARAGVVPYLPNEVRRPYRGCRASTKQKAKRLVRKWRYNPSVPSVILGNVNSLPNKIDELAALVNNVRTYRECSLLCFCETWLTANILDANVELPRFSTV